MFFSITHGVTLKGSRVEMPSRSPGSRGFGLLEFIIAIVILGALILATLQGREMLISMRAMVTWRQIEQIQNKIEAYRAAHVGAFPGDDPKALRRYNRQPAMGRLGQTLIDQTNNGRIDGRLSDFSSPDGEQFMAWRDLRYDGLLDGDPSFQGSAAMPENPFGGVFGFDEGNLGLKTNSLCATQIPGSAASAIDRKLDDGVMATGRLVATGKDDPSEGNHFSAPDEGDYVIENKYIICYALLP